MSFRLPSVLLRVDADSSPSAPLGPGRYRVVRGAVAWRPLPTLLGVTFWGRLRERSIESVGEILSAAIADGASRFVVDIARLDRDAVSGEARQRFFRDIVIRLDRHQATLERGALVTGNGDAAALLVGTIVLHAPVAGWVIGSDLRRVATEWYDDRGAALAALIDGLLASELAPLDVVHRLRDQLGRHPRYTLAECSRALRTTTRSLQRALALAGTSFANERTEVRLELAAALLDRSRYKIEAVAHTVGFSSMPHFSACFRDRFGETPHQFRQRRDGQSS